MNNPEPFIEIFFPRYVCQAEPSSSWNINLEETLPCVRWYKYHGFKKFLPHDAKFNWIEVIVIGWKCQVNTCPHLATHRNPGGSESHCSKHKLDSMELFRRATCEIKGCTQTPTHGFSGQPPSFCKKHAPKVAEKNLPNIPVSISTVNADKTLRNHDDKLRVKPWGGSYFVRVEQSSQVSGIQHDQIRLKVQTTFGEGVAYSRRLEIWSRDDKLFSDEKKSNSSLANRIGHLEIKPNWVKRSRTSPFETNLTPRSAHFVRGDTSQYNSKSQADMQELEKKNELLQKEVVMLRKQNEALRNENNALKEPQVVCDTEESEMERGYESDILDVGVLNPEEYSGESLFKLFGLDPTDDQETIQILFGK